MQEKNTVMHSLAQGVVLESKKDWASFKIPLHVLEKDLKVATLSLL